MKFEGMSIERAQRIIARIKEIERLQFSGELKRIAEERKKSNATIRIKEEHRSGGWYFRPQIVVEFSETHSQYFDEVWWNTPYKQ